MILPLVPTFFNCFLLSPLSLPCSWTWPSLSNTLTPFSIFSSTSSPFRFHGHEFHCCLSKHLHTPFIIYPLFITCSLSSAQFLSNYLLRNYQFPPNHYLFSFLTLVPMWLDTSACSDFLQISSSFFYILGYVCSHLGSLYLKTVAWNKPTGRLVLKAEQSKAGCHICRPNNYGLLTRSKGLWWETLQWRTFLCLHTRICPNPWEWDSQEKHWFLGRTHTSSELFLAMELLEHMMKALDPPFEIKYFIPKTQMFEYGG